MPIDSTHPLYDEHLPQWQKCRDFYNGMHAVKARKTGYIPNFFARNPASISTEEQTQYENYLERAEFYGATGRTVKGLVGSAMRKAPVLMAPDVIQRLGQNLFGTKAGISTSSGQVLSDQLISGRTALLLDRKANTGNSAATNKPLQASIYQSESVINWATNDDDAINWAVLYECTYERDPMDRYKWVEVERYRELIFDGRYVQLLHTRLGKGSDDFITEEIDVSSFGRPLDMLPFIIVTPMGETTEIFPSPILDLVNANHAHYRKQADLDHGEHFTALPTAYITGAVKDDFPDGEMVLGSTGTFLIANSQASVGYLEFKGDGLTSLRTSTERIEKRMGELGARMMSNAPRGVETAQAAVIRSSNENATLASVVTATEMALSHLFSMAAQWEGVSGEISFTMNDDFIDKEIDPQTLAALLQTWQAGGMSLPTFLWNLKRGEVLPDEISAEDEIERIALDGGGLAMPEANMQS